MSLTSRLSGLFTTSDIAHATAEKETESVSVHDGFAERHTNIGVMREPGTKMAGEAAVAADGDGFEMKRPPYLHVSGIHPPIEQRLTVGTGNACWGHRRDDW